MGQKMFIRCHCKACNKAFKDGLVLRCVIRNRGYAWGEPLRDRQGVLEDRYVKHPKFAAGRSAKTQELLAPTE